MTDIKTLNKQITSFLTGYKNSAKTMQTILENFINSYNLPDGLNKNSTPLDKLLKGIRKTDCELVKIYIKTVTNAKVYLNAKGNYTLKLDGAELTTNEKFETTCWNDAHDKVVVTPVEYYNNMKQALAQTEKTLNKAFKTARTDDEVGQLKALINKILNPEE